MDDAVLLSRLGALRNSLSVVTTNLASKAWNVEKMGGEPRAEMLESSLWLGLEVTLISEIKQFVTTLDEIETNVENAKADGATLSAAWTQYAAILADSQNLLRECLEIIGTLAIRSRDLDRKALYVADEFIRDCLTLSVGVQAYYLLVNSMGESFSQARAQIIRMRFPEWTLWDLPLAAHELGHVVIETTVEREKKQLNPLRELTSFLATQRDSLVAKDPELNKKHQRGGNDAKEAVEWAMARVRTFAADAVATYTAGPAYACGAIMLRFNPSVPAQRDAPAHAQRAYLVLSMLQTMNEGSGIDSYGKVINKLTAAWNEMVTHSSPASQLSDVDKEYLSSFARGFQRVGTNGFIGTAAYPVAGTQNDGWHTVEGWYLGWQELMKNGEDLKAPLPEGGKLRDVLNALWLCRLMHEGTPAARKRAYKSLEKVGQELCISIIPSRVEVRRIRPAGANG